MPVWSHYLEWRRKPPSPVQRVSVLSTDEKVALFRRLFRGVMIYGPFVGKVKPAANQGTLLPALTNGRREYAVNPG